MTGLDTGLLDTWLMDTWLHTGVAVLAAGLGFWVGYRFRGRIARRQRRRHRAEQGEA